MIQYTELLLTSRRAIKLVDDVGVVSPVGATEVWRASGATDPDWATDEEAIVAWTATGAIVLWAIDATRARRAMGAI